MKKNIIKAAMITLREFNETNKKLVKASVSEILNHKSVLTEVLATPKMTVTFPDDSTVKIVFNGPDELSKYAGIGQNNRPGSMSPNDYTYYEKKTHAIFDAVNDLFGDDAEMDFENNNTLYVFDIDVAKWKSQVSKINSKITSNLKKAYVSGQYGDPRYPFNTPEEKWLDLMHDGEGDDIKQITGWLENAFHRKLTPTEKSKLQRDWNKLMED